MASWIDWAPVWPNGPVTNEGRAVPKEEPCDVKYTRAVAIGSSVAALEAGEQDALAGAAAG